MLHLLRVGLVGLLFAGCDGGKDTGGEDSAPQVVGPTIEHEPPEGVLDGEALTFTAIAHDDDGHAGVSLFHRAGGDDNWRQTVMELADGAWTATLEGAEVAAPEVEYYFKATDNGDPPATTYLPEGSTEDPFVVPITLLGRPLPFVESFELAEGQSGLTDLGWANASEGYLGYAWSPVDTRAFDGTYAVHHARGYGDSNEMEDWLVSPPIDLSTVTDAQVSWYEYGINPDLGVHELWVTTGERDPEGGDWQLVATLPPAPDEAWARADVVDLSAWVGNTAVSIAWVYEGAEADDWFVDQVVVEELQPWLDATWTVSPSPIGPGEDGTLTVEVTNVAGAEAPDATATLVFPDGGVSVEQASDSLGTVSPGTTALAEFTLHVDESTPDNSYVPVVVEVVSGDDTWSFEGELLVGETSTARVVFSPAETGSVELVLGVGDPDAPTWETTAFSGEATGTVDVTVDVTDQRDFLPPSAGDGRWYLRATPQIEGELDLFVISWDGQDYACDDLPVLTAGESAWAYVPVPPAFDPTLTTSPSSLSPGDAATVTLAVTNGGSDSTGSVLATLASADADVVVTDGGPVDLGEIAGGVTERVVDAFAIEVSADHTDSSDVALELTLTDDAESWVVPVSLAVPYPVLRVTRIDVDDDGRDGILDPGEAAEISFDVTNVGDESCDGQVTGGLEAESSSTATVTITASTERFGGIVAGSTAAPDDPWEVVADGADGDTVDFLLTLTDASRTYEVRASLTLGEPPWQALSPTDDDVGDTVAGWDFDIVNGRYRVLDGTLQIELESATPYDASTLFVEAWGEAAAADWYYYRMLLQSGTAKMQGYGSSGFVDIATLTVTYPDAYTVRFETPVADLGLATDAIDLGFASGWCGPDTYYCDHFPNDWGYPYVSFDPSDWFALSW
ncbi:MAG: choice-of-anchor J domain-containing protein [Myxococcota bacterium]